MTSRKPRCYLAHSKVTYGTAFAKSRVAALHRQLPGWQIIDPEAQHWASSNDWLAAWPSTLDGLDAFAIFGEPGTSFVGAGCFSEWHDAVLCGLALLGLDDSGALHELTALAPLPDEVRNMRRCARLILGLQLDAADAEALTTRARTTAAPGRIGSKAGSSPVGR
ncbi:MAG: hypothetical protein ACYDGN_16330 [Acidimicrobiales bacterium]